MKDGDRYIDPSGRKMVYNEEQLEAAKAYEIWVDWVLNSWREGESSEAQPIL